MLNRRISRTIVDITGIASLSAGLILVYFKQPTAFTYLAIAAGCYFWATRKDFTASLLALLFTLAVIYFLYCIVVFFNPQHAS